MTKALSALVVLACVTSLSAQGSTVALREIPTGYALSTPELSHPTIRDMTMPFYPPEAIRAKVEGLLDVKVVIDETGAAKWAQVVRSLDKTYGLDEQAMFAISKWQFEPAVLNGKAVAVTITCQFRFLLPGRVLFAGISQ